MKAFCAKCLKRLEADSMEVQLVSDNEAVLTSRCPECQEEYVSEDPIERIIREEPDQAELSKIKEKLEGAKKERAEAAKNAKQAQEVADLMGYMIENCPRGQEYQLLSQIVSLLFAFEWEVREDALEFYEKWREVHGETFAPASSMIEKAIRRAERDRASHSPPEPYLPPRYGGGLSPGGSRMQSFMDDMERGRLASEIGRSINGPGRGMD